MNYPLRHVSIRVPWHDTGWDGRVCAKPRLDGACLKLKRIGQNRNDDAEEAVAGKSLKELPQEQWPCCVAERVGFMAPFEYTRIANHPYNRGRTGRRSPSTNVGAPSDARFGTAVSEEGNPSEFAAWYRARQRRWTASRQLSPE